MGSRFFRSECGMTRSTEPACAFARRPSIVAPGGSANVEAEAARNWRLVQRMFSPLCCGFSCFDLTSLNGCTAFQLSGLARNGQGAHFRGALCMSASITAGPRVDYGVGGVTGSDRHFQLRVQAVASLGKLLRSEEHTSELQSLMRISYAV